MIRAGDINDFVGRLRSEAAARRSGRRRRLLLLASFVSLLLVVAAIGAPSFICATSFGDSLLTGALAPYGWTAKAGAIRVGWMTPLEFDDLRLEGPSGATEIKIGQLRTALYASDLLDPPGRLGPIKIVAARVRGVIAPGASSLENDIAAFFDSPSSHPGTEVQIDFEKCEVVVDCPSEQRQWWLRNLEGDLALEQQAERITCSASGEAGEEGGSAGVLAAAVQGEIDRGVYEIELQNEAVPLALLDALAVRYRDRGLPKHVAGTVDGVTRIDIGAGVCRLATKRTSLSDLTLLLDDSTAKPVAIGDVQFSGNLATDGTALRGKAFEITSDLGVVAIDGLVDLAKLDGVATPWADVLAGTAEAKIDLAAASDLLAAGHVLRKGVRVQSGTLQIRAANSAVDNAAGSDRRIVFNGATSAVAAETPDGQVVVQPISIDAQLLARPGGIEAERVEVRSIFADATAAGSLRKGDLQFDVDLAKMSSIVSPLLDLNLAQLGGRSRGSVNWAVQPDSSWKLNGTASAAQFQWQTPDGVMMRQPSMTLNVLAVGRWEGDKIAELAQTKLSVNDSSQRWTLELTQRVDAPTLDTQFPFRALGSGRLDQLEQTVRPWLPAQLHALGGNYECDVRGLIGRSGPEIRAARVSVEQATAKIGTTRIAQPTLSLVFDGWLDTRSGTLRADTLQVIGHAISCSAMGSLGSVGESLEFAYRADLRRIAEALSDHPVLAADTIRPASAEQPSAGVAKLQRWAEGAVTGNGLLTRRTAGLHVEANAEATELALYEQNADASGARFAGPVGPATLAAPRQLWYEPKVSAKLVSTIDDQWEIAKTELVRLDTGWAVATLEGQVVAGPEDWEIALTGPARIDNAKASQRVAAMLGNLQLTGTSENPLELHISPSDPESQSPAFTAKYKLQWESAQLAGLAVGPATVPLVIRDDRVQFEQAVYSVNGGTMTLAGQVDWGRVDGPVVQIAPGSHASGVRIDPALCRGWLKYIAPAVADATEVDGVLGFELDEVQWYPAHAANSRLSGRIQIDGARLGPGPMLRDVENAINLLRAAAGREVNNRGARRWLDLPSQLVDFEVSGGQVHHNRLQMRIGDIDLWSSGTVSMDGTVNVSLQVPVKAEWVEKTPVLASYAGQTLTLPVDGTLNRPSLDSNGISKIVSQLGARTLEEKAGNLIQRELSRGLDKLFGK